MSENVVFKSGNIEIEGLFSRGASGKGVVVTHPHPLYGGDMYNPVVESISRAYSGRGYGVLRFNFRGVGGSGGCFDEGSGESQDVAAAIAFLSEKGFDEISLSGYSFGTWVNARLACSKKIPINHMSMVAPPVAFMDFSGIGPLPDLAFAVAGQHDDIAPPSEIKKMMKAWNSDAGFYEIKGADHFFMGCFESLEKVLAGRI